VRARLNEVKSLKTFSNSEFEIFPKNSIMLYSSYALEEDKDKDKEEEEERMTTTTSFFGIGGGPEDYSYSNNDASAGVETVGEFPKFASPLGNDDVINVNDEEEDATETNLMLLASREIERLREENAQVKRSAREIASKCARNLSDMRERLTRITQRDKREREDEMTRMRTQMEKMELKCEQLREEVRKQELEMALEKQRTEQNEEVVREMKKRATSVALDCERAKMLVKKEKERRRRRRKEKASDGESSSSESE